MGGAVVEQRDIEIFLTLAEELHFGRTAERLHVSTAGVSQTIKKLERRIGMTLFERTAETSRIRAFHQTVRDFVDARASPLADPDPRNGGTRRWT
jgi:DNA-binding transcriptional LysR family regulator